MRKFLLLLFAAVVSSVTSFAAEDSYTISFKNNTTTSDKSSALATSSSPDDIIEQGSENVISCVVGSYVYLGKKDNGLKFSSTSKNGSLTINLAREAQVVPTKVVVKCAGWTTSKGKISLNGSSATLIGTAKTLKDLEFTDITEKLTSIDIAATDQIYVKSITVYYDSDNAASEEAIPEGEGTMLFYAKSAAISSVTATHQLEIAKGYFADEAVLGSIEGGATISISHGETTTTSYISSGEFNIRADHIFTITPAENVTITSFKLACSNQTDLNVIAQNESTSETTGISHLNGFTWPIDVAKIRQTNKPISVSNTSPFKFSYISISYVKDANHTSAIDNISSDEDANAPVEYYNLQGIRVNPDNLTTGVYLRRQGSKTSKVLVR